MQILTFRKKRLTIWGTAEQSIYAELGLCSTNTNAQMKARGLMSVSAPGRKARQNETPHTTVSGRKLFCCLSQSISMDPLVLPQTLLKLCKEKYGRIILWSLLFNITLELQLKCLFSCLFSYTYNSVYSSLRHYHLKWTKTNINEKDLCCQQYHTFVFHGYWIQLGPFFFHRTAQKKTCI